MQGGPGLYRVVVGSGAGTTGTFTLTLDTLSPDEAGVDTSDTCFGSALAVAAANLQS